LSRPGFSGLLDAVDAFIFTRDFVTLVVLAGVLAIDDRAGWQGLFSQPLFASLIVGLVVGRLEAAMAVGLAMELVWLAILPMRGARRPDGVAGAIVGAGTASMLLQHTGDPRVVFVASACAFAGLCVGEAVGVAGRVMGRFRARHLAGFAPTSDMSVRAVTRRLWSYQLGSLSYIFFFEVVVVALALPMSYKAVEVFTAYAGEPIAAGSSWWLAMLPAFGAAAVLQHYWHRHSNRFLVLAGVVALVVLWVR
jgi:mannose/fructose/N-acetylgalactosamine-specific phosphotransferase system component IIC